MKNKKLKKTSLANLITGYLSALLFLFLIILNMPAESPNKELKVEKIDETTEEAITAELFNGSHDEEVVYINERKTKQTFIRDNDVYIDRGTGVVLDDSPNIISRDRLIGDIGLIPNTDPVLLNNGRVDTDIIINEEFDGHSVVGVDGVGRVRGLHRHGGDHDVYGENNIRSRVDKDVDFGLLDRRLFELDKDIAASNNTNEGLNKIGVEEKGGIDMSNLTLSRNDEDDIELGDLDFNLKDKKGSYGVGKGGELYAYNFPSQGVGAGIGSSAIGAGAGGGAGLSAGIGQGVLDGETVPTLGGIGSQRLIPKNLEVTPENDRDGDGLPAVTESQLGTNPNSADTDGDGINDGDEVAQYSNPLDESSTPQNPGNFRMVKSGGVGGLVGGAGAGGAAGLTQGYVVEKLGLGMGIGAGGKGGSGYGGKHSYDHLPKDGALHIMMHVDGSGSILDTRKQLDIMKDTLLKTALLPYYNNDEDLYNRRVTIISNSGERTLKFFTEAAKKDNVLAIAFQDEAQPSYHLPTFNKKPQDHYSKDINKLKASLNGYGGIYRGVMFQVDRGKTFAKSFKEFVGSAWRGEGYLESNNLKRYHRENNANHIKNKDGIVFSDEYHAKDSGDPKYYLDLIFEASKKVGLNLDIYGAGLSDGKYNKKKQ
jgi:hypothetical protein|tara:strand:- start:5399 stop:7354 length:1956 start_codon:yes stop_codon:yes gene_type:complete